MANQVKVKDQSDKFGTLEINFNPLLDFRPQVTEVYWAYPMSPYVTLLDLEDVKFNNEKIRLQDNLIQIDQELIYEYDSDEQGDLTNLMNKYSLSLKELFKLDRNEKNFIHYNSDLIFYIKHEFLKDAIDRKNKYSGDRKTYPYFKNNFVAETTRLGIYVNPSAFNDLNDREAEDYLRTSLNVMNEWIAQFEEKYYRINHDESSYENLSSSHDKLIYYDHDYDDTTYMHCIEGRRIIAAELDNIQKRSDEARINSKKKFAVKIKWDDEKEMGTTNLKIKFVKSDYIIVGSNPFLVVLHKGIQGKKMDFESLVDSEDSKKDFSKVNLDKELKNCVIKKSDIQELKDEIPYCYLIHTITVINHIKLRIKLKVNKFVSQGFYDIFFKQVRLKMHEENNESSSLDQKDGIKFNLSVENRYKDIILKTKLSSSDEKFIWPRISSDYFKLIKLPIYLELAINEASGFVKEQPGKSNQTIEKYHHSCAWGSTRDDEVAWCSAFVNYCIANSKGYESYATRNARAVSWGGHKWMASYMKDKHGKDRAISKEENPIEKYYENAKYVGTIMGWKNNKKEVKGHVGFIIAENEQGYYLLGGNQGDMVNITFFKKKYLEYREKNNLIFHRHPKNTVQIPLPPEPFPFFKIVPRGMSLITR